MKIVKEKYTLEEFEEMFKEAEIETIKKLDEDMQKTQNKMKEGMSGIGSALFTMQNMMCINRLKNILFNKEADDNE